MTTTPDPRGATRCARRNARRGTSTVQAKVHLDRNALARIEAIKVHAEATIGIRPSASVVMRTALRIMSEAYSGDPVGEAAPGRDLLSLIRAAVQGR
jgi:hypothetical protein